MSNNSNQDYSVSVVIPAYNSEQYIARAIDSVLAQTLLPNEIIVVDDGSTDGTKNAVAKYGDKVKYVYQDNSGAGAARNAGIKAAKSDWIAFLDADDEWLPEYLETQVEILRSNPELAWSTTNFYTCLCAENRKAPFGSVEKLKRLLAGKTYFDDYLFAYMNRAEGHTDAMIIRKDVLIDVGLFDTSLRNGQDFDLWLKVSHKHPPIGFCGKPMIIYHVQIDGSLTCKPVSLDMRAKIIENNMPLAQAAGRESEFTKFSSWRIRRWIRSAMFDKRCASTKVMAKKYRKILPLWFKLSVSLLTIYPAGTVFILHQISRIIRLLRLRKIAVKPPYKG